MNKKIIALAVITILSTMLFSGCNEQTGLQTDNTSNLHIGAKETIKVDTTGGIFSLFDDKVQLNFESSSVTKSLDITVEEISNPITDSSIEMYSVYEFGPDGTNFDKPVNLIIKYDVDYLPEGVEESDIKMYVINGNTWEEIEGSFSNVAMHWVAADISHFSKMGCGSSSSGGGGNSTGGSGSGSNSSNSSAQYWFKADLYTYSFKSPRLTDWADSDTYHCGVSAYWDPVSYAQYYQLKFVFNGNEPGVYGWLCDFRQQGKSYCNDGPLQWKEGKIYQYGGDPNKDGFIGQWKTGDCTAGVLNEDTGEVETFVYARLFPEQKHGTNFIVIDDEVEDYEELSAVDIAVLQTEMETFILDYIDGWEVWVRGVTETQS